MRPHLSFRRTLMTIAPLVAALAAVPSAHAGPLVAAAPNCEEQETQTPFKPWWDPAHYVLMPSGHFEGVRQWQLAGGAGNVRGNEWFYVHRANEVWSLGLPSGSSATTPPVCVGIEHPTLRFFARNDGASSSTLAVEVLFETADGRVRSALIGTVAGGPGWVPTPPYPITVNLLALLPGERTAVAFRFTPSPGGDWHIDDVYFDPWRHG